MARSGPAQVQDEPSVEANDAAPDDDPSTPPGNEEPGTEIAEASAEAPDPPGFELASRTSVSSRGEAALELLSRIPWRSVRLLAGTGAGRAVQGPARVSALLGVELPGEATSGEVLFRLVPAQAGASLLAARAEARHDHAPWAGVVSVETARFALAPGTAPTPAGLTLWSALVTLEVQHQLPAGFALQAHGAAALCRLSTSGLAQQASLWQVPGTKAGQWPQRAAAGLGLRLEQPAWSGQLSVTYELPAMPGASAVEFGVSAERRWPGLGVGAELAAALQEPSGQWLGRAVLELRWR